MSADAENAALRERNAPEALPPTLYVAALPLGVGGTFNDQGEKA